MLPLVLQMFIAEAFVVFALSDGMATLPNQRWLVACFPSMGTLLWRVPGFRRSVEFQSVADAKCGETYPTKVLCSKH